MIASTAKRTAERAGLTFDENRLLTDPTFNAQLGAAHLGALIAEQGGSLILTFAAYNAGGKHVKEWIEAHGDPRSPGVDPIDWVERIPFTETRNYVQRVLENLAIYQAEIRRDQCHGGTRTQEDGSQIVIRPSASAPALAGTLQPTRQPSKIISITRRQPLA